MASAERWQDFDIEHGQACVGLQGAYVATLFHLNDKRRLVVATNVQLGNFKPVFADAKELFHIARERAEKERDMKIPVEACVALNAARVCARRRHTDGYRNKPDERQRVERAAALAIVHDPYTRTITRPLDAAESNALQMDHGVGLARRRDLGMTSLRIVRLPISPAERRLYVPYEAAQAAPTVSPIQLQPHIIVHRRGEQTLEQIVTLAEL